jgi:hypothetical protein
MAQINKLSRITGAVANFSPRSVSSSTLATGAVVESCSPGDTSISKNGYVRDVKTSPFIASVYGTFPPMDPYIYCQNDPTYTVHSATAVWVGFILFNSVTGQPGWAQIGLRKYRSPGTTQINKDIYLEMGTDTPNPSDPTKYFITSLGAMPSTPTLLKVTRD